MNSSALLKLAGFVFVVGLIALLYWLTLAEPVTDPCAEPQTDISGAVLSDGGDQDALVNRAIIMKAKCKERTLKETSPEETPEQSN
jgi:hypothetical protein